MENVKFDDNSGFSRGGFDETPKLVKMVLKTGITDSVAVANYILIGIAVCCVLIAGFFFIKATAKPKSNVDPKIIEQMNQQLFQAQQQDEF